MKSIVLAVLLLAASGTVAADHMRCGNDLVLKGDHVSQVHSKCGEPVRTTRLENEFGARVGKREMYDSAHGTGNHVVTYRDERVVSIERLRSR
ncbi:DUF2845 domain-containing protein [Aquisalimonas sp. 2447]|uniref:DUF2845 domain-containing protein n=1 Tax=Aquisalimonas sp. 2447 TaxID=2740807 RepID=UPI0014327B5F|nr:DUF2845 domain-containing protein [Aquisalimonas sp. 2447]QIT56104.1 DUF2845 domain-containing protein [Aquisalimonas sp. 2447]